MIKCDNDLVKEKVDDLIYARIMIDRVFRPHETVLSEVYQRLVARGWKFTQLWDDVGDDVYNARMTNGSIEYDIILGWTNGITPLRWAEIPSCVL